MKALHYVSVFVVRPAADPATGGHELLLGLRAAGGYMGGTWQLISGGIEPDETAWQAAMREVAEETGLAVRELYRLPQVASFYRVDADAVCTGVMFCARTDAGAEPTINAEHARLEWLPLDTAGERLMWQSDRLGLDDVRTQILGNGKAKPYLRIGL